MNPYLLPGLEHGAQAVANVFGKIDPSQWDRPTGPNRFSPREVIAHMADFEPVWLERMIQAVERPGSILEPRDEDQMAIDHRYKELDPIAELAKFRESRARVVEFLKGLKPEQFSSAATHPQRGEMRVEDIANLVLGHDLYHLEQLSQYL